jgi:hypothetical protein
MKPHDDKSLNALRLLAMGAVGLYLYKAWAKEGTLAGTLSNPQKFDVNTDRLVDSAMPWLGLQGIEAEAVRSGAKQFLSSMKDQLLYGKGSKK